MYGSTDARFEVNTHFNTKVSDKWSSSLFVHGNARVEKMDKNDDGFMDNPLAKQINVLNRWQYADAEKGWVSFINFRYMKDEKQTGEMDFDVDRDKGKLIFGVLKSIRSALMFLQNWVTFFQICPTKVLVFKMPLPVINRIRTLA